MPQAFGMYVHTIMERGTDEAQRSGSATIEAEHLLLAIAAEQESATRELLDSVGSTILNRSRPFSTASRRAHRTAFTCSRSEIGRTPSPATSTRATAGPSKPGNSVASTEMSMKLCTPVVSWRSTA